MGYAVELYFDADSDRAVRNLWKRIADAVGPSYMPESGARPHVSLAVYDHLDSDGFACILEKFAKTLVPFDFMLSSVGTFPTKEGAVFLAPVVNQDLLTTHKTFHDAFAKYRASESPYYFPGSWVPHCTVALDLKPDQIGGAVESCWGASLPIQGNFEQISILEFRPVKELVTYALG